VRLNLNDAARGLTVALVERDDIASGTSSKSSKLVHGGLRYLQNGEVRLVYEALRERRRRMHNAPHLVELMPFLIPIMTRDGVISRKLARALGSTMWMYDLTGGWRIGKLHRRISGDAASKHFPTAPQDKLSAGYLYFDSAADDARLVLTIARTAAALGAAVANRCAVAEILHDASGRACGARVDDRVTGHQFDVAARQVVNATGVWADEVRALDEPVHPDSIRPAKGVHITIPWHMVGNDIAVIIPVRRDKRSLFLIPWGRNGDGTFRHTYVGTTDTAYEGGLDQPQCEQNDIDYILEALDQSLTTEVTADDITGMWAGLRPLVATDDRAPGTVGVDAKTADLSRRHAISVSGSGVVTVTGGKLTTYREMAEDTIDVVLAADDHRGGFRHRHRHPTRRLRLLGARSPAGPEASARSAHLTSRYGTLADEVRALIAFDPSLAEPLVAGLPYVRAEVVYAARAEMAVTLADVLIRRTRAHLFDRAATIEAAPDAADLLAAELEWDVIERDRQLADYLAICAAEAAAMKVSVTPERTSA
jgi:glycerol-3-phosphate dehydrogenase